MPSPCRMYCMSSAFLLQGKQWSHSMILRIGKTHFWPGLLGWCTPRPSRVWGSTWLDRPSEEICSTVQGQYTTIFCCNIILFLCLKLTIVDNCIVGWGDPPGRWCNQCRGTWRHTYCDCLGGPCSTTLTTTLWQDSPTVRNSDCWCWWGTCDGVELGLDDPSSNLPRPLPEVHQDVVWHCPHRVSTPTTVVVIRVVCECTTANGP
jgi:hypothetical protein